METIPQWLLLVIPLVIIQLILMVVALVDLSRRERTRGPKLLWVFVIVLGELIGPLIYLSVGREE